MAAHVRGGVRLCTTCQSYFSRYSRGTSVWNFSRSASDLSVNHKWKIDPEVQKHLEKESVKHRRHPGIMRVRKVQLPALLRDAVSNMIETYPSQNLEKQSTSLANYLWSRHRPTEDEEMQARATNIESKILSKEKIDFDNITQEELSTLKSKMQVKFISQLKSDVYHWKPVRYNAYKAFLYLVGRMSQDYSAVYQIFSEIAKRKPSFSPVSFFDFGSGVGSGIWAINEMWNDSVKEHYCVDSSGDMNTLARLLLQDGDAEKEMCIPGVYFRQFMPPSHEKKYDVVLCAFSLMELKNQSERLNTLYSLWQKTEQYLVIVENGTNAGFINVAEAREFILSLGSNEHLSEEERSNNRGHVFSPCPHNGSCGRLARHDGTPCNFTVSYKPLLKSKDDGKNKNAVYSYVVLKKGEKSDTPDSSWPRIIREVSNPSRRVHLRTCCPDGDMQLSIITSNRHGRDLYWCAKNCKLGDLLPVVPAEEEEGMEIKEGLVGKGMA